MRLHNPYVRVVEADGSAHHEVFRDVSDLRLNAYQVLAAALGHELDDEALC